MNDNTHDSRSHCDPSRCSECVQSAKRRRFLGFSIGVINIGLATAIFGPVLGFAGAPLRRKRGNQWVPIAKESEIASGEIREVTFTTRVKDGYHMVDRRYTVFLQRSDDGIVCIDPACTHLGCRVIYQADQHRFMCPCHGGVFDDQGQVVSGPPPKPLERHAVKVEDGQVWIQKEA